jgi:hypothetical protein
LGSKKKRSILEVIGYPSYTIISPWFTMIFSLFLVSFHCKSHNRMILTPCIPSYFHHNLQVTWPLSRWTYPYPMILVSKHSHCEIESFPVCQLVTTKSRNMAYIMFS